MDPLRKHQILNAEARFTHVERLTRALAEKGVYVLGGLTHDTLELGAVEPASSKTRAEQAHER